MKNFKPLFLVCFALVTMGAYAQVDLSSDPNIASDSPNTETAFLSNDFKYQQSGYERVDGGRLNVQPGVSGQLRFSLEAGYDYVFIGIADAVTEGMAITGKPINYDGNVFETDTAFVYPEHNSRVLAYPLPDAMLGEVEIRPTLLGKVAPKESSYYLLMRKKSAY